MSHYFCSLQIRKQVYIPPPQPMRHCPSPWDTIIRTRSSTGFYDCAVPCSLNDLAFFEPMGQPSCYIDHLESSFVCSLGVSVAYSRNNMRAFLEAFFINPVSGMLVTSWSCVVKARESNNLPMVVGSCRIKQLRPISLLCWKNPSLASTTVVISTNQSHNKKFQAFDRYRLGWWLTIFAFFRLFRLLCHRPLQISTFESIAAAVRVNSSRTALLSHDQTPGDPVLERVFTITEEVLKCFQLVLTKPVGVCKSE